MVDPKNIQLQPPPDGTPSVLRKAVVYQELFFYKRSDILYQLTVAFCRRFLPKYGDRTVDQMVQAARSTMQNIAEGSVDGQTSVETELKLSSITCEAITPPACGEAIFKYINKSIPLFVPEESIEAYKAADQWSEFTNILAIGSEPQPCDTIIVQLADTITEGEVYMFGENELTDEGTYEMVFKTENGCDSTVILTLTVIIPEVQETVVVINGVEIVINDSTGAGETEVDILGDSTLVYNTEDNTLTFNNLTMESDDSVTTAISYTGTETLTIVLNDSSTIIADTVITSTADIIITGEGTLVAEGVVPIVGVPDANILFDSVNMYVHSLSSHAAVRRRIKGILQVDEDGGPALSGFGSVDFNKTNVTPPDALYGPVQTGEGEGEWINALYVLDTGGTPTALTEFTLTAQVDESAVEKVSTPQALDPQQPMYNILGMPVREGYTGVVIQNGRTYLLW